MQISNIPVAGLQRLSPVLRNCVVGAITSTGYGSLLFVMWLILPSEILTVITVFSVVVMTFGNIISTLILLCMAIADKIPVRDFLFVLYCILIYLPIASLYCYLLFK
jgi:hypothetical protein